MHMDPLIPVFAGVGLVILMIGLTLKRFHQPYVIAYVLAGVLLGQYGLGVITDAGFASRAGALGVLLLMFFVGMELPVKSLMANWRVPIIGTALQIGFSVLCVWAIGAVLDWPMRRIVFLGFVISMSSTAVLLNVLRETGELDQPLGRDVAGITITQDLAVIPMFIVLGLLNGDTPAIGQFLIQLVGGCAILLALIAVIRRGQIAFPGAKTLEDDREMQVFTALTVCFGLSFLAGLMNLSAALGAFAAGVLITASRQTDWVKSSVEPFRIVFMGLFFISVGLLIDLRFLLANWQAIGLLLLATFLTNTGINAIAIRMLKQGWRQSLYAGALLAQIGEFSFVLAAVGYQTKIISEYGYQMAMAVIALSLLLSPPWIMLFRKFVLKGIPQPASSAL